MLLLRWHRAIGETEAASEPPESVMAALEDDLNTPQAIVEMHKLADAAFAGDQAAAANLKAAGQVVGLLSHTYSQWAQRKSVVVRLEGVAAHGSVGNLEVVIAPDTEEIDQRIIERAEARKNKDFEASDKIRDELAAQGVILEDKPDGTTEWRRA